MLMRRSSGILLHPSSLPGPSGIGELGREALDFVDRLAEAGQALWQVLPLGPTGYGDSPYAPLSTFAGNELLISLSLLCDEGLLETSECEPPYSPDPSRVDFGALVAWKPELLRRAARRFLDGASAERRAELAGFRDGVRSWLPEYALFRAIKHDHEAKAKEEGRDGGLWSNSWPRNLALHTARSVAEASERYAREIAEAEVLQFFFFEQWARVKKAANRKGILIIGDLPIFLALDSAEVWSRRELFLLDAMGRPSLVAGVPPDYFSEKGQLWGNPLYDWERHRQEGFSWWSERLSHALGLYDAVRIDHFRGFEAFWAVPAEEKTARGGSWIKAPGKELFAALAGRLGPGAPIVAEDLGFITEEVRNLRDSQGFPGMRILQFAFDAAESGKAFDPDNAFLPHNYVPRTLVYTGTHDNDTLAGWLGSASEAEVAYLRTYLGYDPPDPAEALLREAWKSVALWALAPLQDILGLGSEARMNTPSTLGGNWTWRMRGNDFTGERIRRLREMTRLYGRLPAP